MDGRVAVTAWDGADSALADLLLAYHRRTEEEKGAPVTGVDELPPRYRREVLEPASAFRGQTVLMATVGSAVAGCVVLTAPRDHCREIKRLWTDPPLRGRGVASRLIDAALDRAGATTVRLTVWHWRAGAIALYEKLGFERVASWEERDGLVCMERVV